MRPTAPVLQAIWDRALKEEIGCAVICNNPRSVHTYLQNHRLKHGSLEHRTLTICSMATGELWIMKETKDALP